MDRKCQYLGCDNKLTGRQTKFCSDTHRKAHHRMVNRPHYLQYNQKYYQTHKQPSYCIVCGRELPKHKKRYCSQSCYMKKYVKVGDYDPNRRGVLPQATRIKCEECGGRVKQDGFDYVCIVCGLVVE